MNRSIPEAAAWPVLTGCGLALFSAAAAAAGLQIVNPASTGVTWSYLIDGQTQSLQAGYSQQIDSACTITFDRGGGLGEAKYSLTDGVYTLTSTDGHWDLFHTDAAPAQAAAAAPSATDEGKPAGIAVRAPRVWLDYVLPDGSGKLSCCEQEFRALDKDGRVLWSNTEAGPTHGMFSPTNDRVFVRHGNSLLALDVHTGKVLWTTELSEEEITMNRLGFVNGRVELGQPFFYGQGGTGRNVWVYAFNPDTGQRFERPPSVDDNRMFREMYGNAGLDPAAMKLVEGDWQSKSHAARKAYYDTFIAKVAAARGEGGGLSATPGTAASSVAAPPPPRPVAATRAIRSPDGSVRLTASGAQIRAVNKTGSVIWTDDSPAGPVKAMACNNQMVFVRRGDSLMALALHTGKTLWSTDLLPQERAMIGFRIEGDSVRLVEFHVASSLDISTGQRLAGRGQTPGIEVAKEKTITITQSQLDKYVAEQIAKGAAGEREKSDAVPASTRQDLSSASASARQDPGPDSHPPVPSAEDNRMFQEMYGEAGLDKATLKMVLDDWKSKTSDQRKAQYASFTKEVEALRQDSSGKSAAQ